jgi:hypothetical protein
MCEAITEKSLLEEKFWRSQLARSTVDDMCKMGLGSHSIKDVLDRNIKETIIKLFAVSIFTLLLWIDNWFQSSVVLSVSPKNQK